MNKFLYSILASLICCTIFVACDDDDDDSSSIGASVTPETAAEGTYTGTWTLITTVSSTSDTAQAAGTIVVTPDSAYVADFNFVCEEIELDMTSNANISYAGSTSKFYYHNSSSTNGLETSFAGQLDNSTMTGTAMFSITQKSGRVETTYTYRFE